MTNNPKLAPLKSCPFCDAYALVFRHEDYGDGVVNSFGVECSGCGAVGSAHETAQEAVTAWNNRIMGLTEDKAVELMAEAMYISSHACEYGALYTVMARAAYRALLGGAE